MKLELRILKNLDAVEKTETMEVDDVMCSTDEKGVQIIVVKNEIMPSPKKEE